MKRNIIKSGMPATSLVSNLNSQYLNGSSLSQVINSGYYYREEAVGPQWFRFIKFPTSDQISGLIFLGNWWNYSASDPIYVFMNLFWDTSHKSYIKCISTSNKITFTKIRTIVGTDGVHYADALYSSNRSNSPLFEWIQYKSYAHKIITPYPVEDDDYETLTAEYNLADYYIDTPPDLSSYVTKEELDKRLAELQS